MLIIFISLKTNKSLATEVNLKPYNLEDELVIDGTHYIVAEYNIKNNKQQVYLKEMNKESVPE